MLTGLLCILCLILPGVAVLLSLPKQMLNSTQKWGLSFGVGSALVSFELFIYFVVARLNFSAFILWFIILQAIAALIFVIYKIPWKQTFQIDWNKIKPLSWLAVVLIAILLFFSLVQALGKPPVAFDNIAFWGMRAKILIEDQVVNFNPEATNYLAAFSHHNYPWHLSFMEYWWRIVGASGGQLNLIAWLYFVSLLILVFDFTRRRLGILEGFILTVVLASQPLIFYHASNNYADLIVGYYAAAAFIFFLQWLDSGNRSQLYLAAALCGWTICIKNYGIFYILSFILGLVLTHLLHIHKQTLKQWFFIALSLILPLLPLALFKTFLSLNLRNSEASYSWHPEALFPFAQALFVGNNWNIWYLAFCVFFVVLIPRIIRNKKLIVAWLMFFSLIAILLVIFTVTENYQWALDHTALSRAFIPLVPISIALIAFSLQDKKYGTILSRF